jgi:hypothetical protein
MYQLVEIIVHTPEDMDRLPKINKGKEKYYVNLLHWLKNQNYDLKLLTDYESNVWFNKVILPRYVQDLKSFNKLFYNN